MMKKYKNTNSFYSTNSIMAHRSFSIHQLVLSALFILLLSTVSMIMFYNFFNDSISNSNDYLNDICFITSIEIKTIMFNCWDNSGYVDVVQMSCVKILSNTKTASSLFFYRNIQEKLFAAANNADCSYIPTACSNNYNYLKSYLESTLSLNFPPVNYKFQCYSNNNDSALLTVPHVKAYYFSLFILSCGFLIGLTMLLYALIYPYYSDTRAKNIRFLTDLNNRFEISHNDNEFYNMIRRVLEQAHLDVENLRDKEIGFQIDENVEHTSDQESIGKFSAMSSRHSFHSHRSNRRLPTDHKIPSASKLKFGESEIHIGRIAYRKPSSARLSRYGSTKTINSVYSFENANVEPTKFYLGDHHEPHECDSDLDIPDIIMEEDERYLTVQKTIYEKRLAANQIFVNFGDQKLAYEDSNKDGKKDDGEKED